MHPADGQTTEPVRWTRLLKAGRPVGYLRRAGRGVLYSRDGYGWSGTAIPHDRQLAQSSIGAPSRRIFHGDIVAFAAGPSVERAVEVVVLVPAPGAEERLLEPKSGRVVALSQFWRGPEPAFASRRLGDVWGRPPLVSALEDAGRLRWAAPEHVNRTAATAALLIVAGVLASGVLQIDVVGSAGPILSLAGGLASAGAYVVWRRSRSAGLLTRDWLGQTTWRVALGCGASAAALSPWVHPEPGPGAALAFMVAGLACGGLVWFLTVEMVAWGFGGHADEVARSPRRR